LGIHIRHGYRWCWWLRNGALSYEIGRQLDGTVEADELYHTAGDKGQARTDGPKTLGHKPRGRRKKREPGRGHYDKDRPAMIAWVSRQGGVVIQATRDFTVKTVQKAAPTSPCKSAVSSTQQTGPIHGFHQLGLKPAGHSGPSAESTCCFFRA
jgi:hypothetical protein